MSWKIYYAELALPQGFDQLEIVKTHFVCEFFSQFHELPLTMFYRWSSRDCLGEFFLQFTFRIINLSYTVFLRKFRGLFSINFSYSVIEVVSEFPMVLQTRNRRSGTIFSVEDFLLKFHEFCHCLAERRLFIRFGNLCILYPIIFGVLKFLFHRRHTWTL